MMCFRKILVAKKFMDRTGGGGVGVSRFSLENFLSHSSEKSFSVSSISGI